MPIREDLHKLSTVTDWLAAIVVVPKPSFVEWLTEYFRSKRLRVRDKGNIHCPPHDSVWLIPPLDLCEHPAEYEEIVAFVNEWKPAMLLAEIDNHGIDRSEFPYEISAQTFDEFFEAHVKHDAAPITFIARLPSGEIL